MFKELWALKLKLIANIFVTYFRNFLNGRIDKKNHNSIVESESIFLNMQSVPPVMPDEMQQAQKRVVSTLKLKLPLPNLHCNTLTMEVKMLRNVSQYIKNYI